MSILRSGNKHKLKLKDTVRGPLSFHLGMDFDRDDDSTLFVSTVEYIEMIFKNYENLFGDTPKQVYASPLEK
jgi:hypothetical protein